MQGRLHAYEGHPAQALAVPIRILKRLGVERLILTNAAGGLKLSLPAGSLMIVEDHINFRRKSLIGPNGEEITGRASSTCRGPTTPNFAKARRRGARFGASPCRRASISTPWARASRRPPRSHVRRAAPMPSACRRVPECLAAIHCGLKVAALSVITNLAADLATEPLTHHESLSDASKAYDRVERLLLRFFAALGT